MAVSAHTADHLPGKLTVAAVDVDEILRLAKRPVAELPGFVVIHGPDQDHHLLDKVIDTRVELPFLRCDELCEHIQIFHKVWDILGLHTKYGCIALRKHTGLVLPQIGGGKVLPDQIFLLHDVTVAKDEPRGAVQRVQQPVQVRRDMSARAAGTEHHNLDRYISRILHRPDPQIQLSGGLADAAPVFCR